MADVDLPFLLGISMFGGLTDEAALAIAARMERRKVPAGTFVVTEGDSARELFIVEDGDVEIVSRHGEPPRELVLANLHTGDFFGEMSLLDVQPRSASARARTDTTLLVLPYKQFHLLARLDPHLFTMLMMNLGREVSRRLREAHRMLFGMLQDGSLTAETTERIFGFGRSPGEGA